MEITEVTTDPLSNAPEPNNAGNIDDAAQCVTNSFAGSCWSTAGGLLLEQVLFFLAGLGSSIGYIATLSSLVYFDVLFGANSFVYLNCAVFLPLLPVSIAQAIYDSRFDLLYQSRVTYLVRVIVGFGFVIGGTLGMLSFAHGPNHSNYDDSFEIFETRKEGLRQVIICALLQGIGGAVLFGQLNQLASFVGSLNQNTNNSDENEALPKKFKATVAAGVQASALVVLLASFGSDFGAINGGFFANFLVRILQVEFLCFFASLWLLLARPRIQVSMLRRDTSMRELNEFSSSDLEEFRQLLSPPPSQQDDDGDDDYFMLQSLSCSSSSSASSSNGSIGSVSVSSGSDTSTMMTLRKLLYHSRLSCLGMWLTLVPSFLVGSWFTHVQTNWMELAQVLFYVRIGSDLVGRFVTILVPPRSIKCVVWIAALRWIVVVAFFANASGKISLDPRGRDALSIVLVAFLAFFSGYLVTSCYQLAPQQLPGPPRARAANVAKQSSLLTVAFSVSAIAGLVMSFFLVALGV
jgi:hypothetical protein